ncbi:MAG: hypothetical protein PUA61_09885, partial [Succinatimonas hippei]|nr:hypothetical protein [Succinatimonas hippei]
MMTTENVKRVISLIEKSGKMRQKNSRLGQGVLFLILEPLRDEVCQLLTICKTYSNVYSVLREDKKIPDFITYKSFLYFFYKYQSSEKEKQIQKTKAGVDRVKATDKISVSKITQNETVQADEPDEPVVKKVVQTKPAAPARKLTREEQDHIDFKKYLKMSWHVFKPKPGIFVDPVPGAQPDSEQILKDGTVVKAGDPRFISNGKNEWRNGIPLYALADQQAEDEWEKDNDMKEVRPVWSEGDYPNFYRPKHLFLLTKFNPGYPKRHIFKSYSYSWANYYGKFPPIFYQTPYLVTNRGLMYDLFYQLPMEEDTEVDRRGEYTFWAYPGRYIENIAYYRSRLDSSYKRDLDIMPNKPPLTGRHAYMYVGPDDI